MVDHVRLERTLSEFAQLLLGEFDVEDVLRRLCDDASAILPVLGAGVSLHCDAAGGSRELRVWASGSDVVALEDLQRRLGEGPCLDVMASGRPLQAEIVPEATRWPLYSVEVARRSVRHIAALPLSARGHTWGALDVYSEREVPFDEHEMRALEVLTDAAAAYLVTAWDRQAREVAENQLRYQALHDPLTGLPNRALLADRLGHALVSAHRRPGAVGVLFVDLDRFKQVNDAYGHAAGDRVLVIVADRLSRGLRASDTMCRVGGDEFILLCEDLHLHDDDLKTIGQRLLETLTHPVSLPEGEVVVGASIGAVLAVSGDSPERVIHDADRAMFVAKQDGGGLVISDRVADAGPIAAMRIETALQHAMDRGEMRVYYQPVVRLENGGENGLEALLRWQHPQRGLLAAGEFVAHLERTGLVLTAGLWVLREVCSHLADTRPTPAPAGWFVSINVSARQLSDPRFTSQVQGVLAETGADSNELMLEVTETALLRDGERGMVALQELSSLGFRIALDDFGTGYSSLAYLTQVPADLLKVDKTFIDRLGRSHKDDALVRATITMAHELGMKVIAEGIETPRQHQILVEDGCDAGQGYLYSHPHEVTGKRHLPRSWIPKTA